MSANTLLWLIFWVTFVGVSVIDYLIVGRRKTPVSVKSALRWTALWIAIGLGFSLAIYHLHANGRTVCTEYITGYLTEYSLSVDNLFVFILIFSVMGVSDAAQPRLIKLGIYFSIVLRIIFILFGIALIERFHWLVHMFGVLLVWTAWRMIADGDGDQVQPEKNLLYKLATRILPIRAHTEGSQRLFFKAEGKSYVTPLFLVLLVIGSTDVIFAVDSIPAIMGISQDPIVVLTSNLFAVLGLNSLYLAIRSVVGMFKFLKHGISFILFFIGAKMIAAIYQPLEDWFQGKPYVTLLVILSVLAISIGLSVWHDRKVRENSRPVR
ncbi:MAG: TerC/Alx family metal homeostasis membrane protein [Nibricoccus sp.]